MKIKQVLLHIIMTYFTRISIITAVKSTARDVETASEVMRENLCAYLLSSVLNDRCSSPAPFYEDIITAHSPPENQVFLVFGRN